VIAEGGEGDPAATPPPLRQLSSVTSPRDDASSVVGELLEDHSYLQKLAGSSYCYAQFAAAEGGEEAAPRTAAERLRARRAAYSTYPPRGARLGARRGPAGGAGRGSRRALRLPGSGTGSPVPLAEPLTPHTGLARLGVEEGSSRSGSTAADSALGGRGGGDAAPWAALPGVAALELTPLAAALHGAGGGAMAAAGAWLAQPRSHGGRLFSGHATRAAAASLSLDAPAPPRMAGGHVQPHVLGPLPGAGTLHVGAVHRIAAAAGVAVDEWAAGMGRGWGGSVRAVAALGALRVAYV